MTTSTGTGGTSTALVAVAASTPLRALLDDGELDARAPAAPRAAARLALADGDLALLAVADGDGRRARAPRRDLLAGRLARAQNIGR